MAGLDHLAQVEPVRRRDLPCCRAQGAEGGLSTAISQQMQPETCLVKPGRVQTVNTRAGTPL